MGWWGGGLGGGLGPRVRDLEVTDGRGGGGERGKGIGDGRGARVGNSMNNPTKYIEHTKRYQGLCAKTKQVFRPHHP